MFSLDFINNHSNLTFKDQTSMGLRSFGGLIKDYGVYEFDPGFEVLDTNKPLQLNISTNKRGKGN